MKSKVYNYGQQFIDNEDKKAVNKVLCGKYLTTGPYVEKFEKKAQNTLNQNMQYLAILEHQLFIWP